MTLILAPDQTLAGIFTDGDLRRALDKGIDVREASIDELMTHGGKTARPEMLAAEALKIMEDHKISSLPVINEHNQAIGALNMHDLLRAGVM
jgi:arabinose-5-phosphate isomerase